MDELTDEDAEWIKKDLEGKEDIEVMDGKEYKYQLSTRKGEDILVIRGESLDEIFTELTEAKEKYGFNVRVTAGANPPSSTGGTYICKKCGLPAKLISGTNARGEWKGIACSSEDRSHTEFLH
jgi:hypothetical protein